MPAKSVAQRRLMGAALGGASVPAAEKIRESMTTKQIKDFAQTSEKKLPEHVKRETPRSSTATNQPSRWTHRRR